jgi:hypothetical protein
MARSSCFEKQQSAISTQLKPINRKGREGRKGLAGEINSNTLNKSSFGLPINRLPCCCH